MLLGAQCAHSLQSPGGLPCYLPGAIPAGQAGLRSHTTQAAFAPVAELRRYDSRVPAELRVVTFNNLSVMF